MKDKRKLTIIGASIICAILLIIGGVLIFKSSKEINQDSLNSILSKGTSLESFKSSDDSVIFTIKADLDENDLLSLSKDLIKLDNDKNYKFYVFEKDTKEPVVKNGFYANGLNNTVVVDGKNKIASISNYDENEVEAKELEVYDFTYGDVRNDDGLAFVSVNSKTLKEDKAQDQLLVVAEIIKNLNKENDITEVVVSTPINDVEYGVSTTNSNIIQTTKKHKI